MDCIENVVRIACPDIPAPFSPPLQKAYMPARDKLAESIRHIV
jgi:pyruvate/2-oxoglutarate/acetoin dehydrogenase E1 component